MNVQVTINRSGACIHKTISGALEIESSILLVHELTVAAVKYNRHNILVDIVDADIRLGKKDIIKVAAECGALLSGFRFKIAAIYPTCD